jgi:hypothetical protein
MTTDGIDSPTDSEMAILSLVHERAIREVLHFTTNLGLIGILAKGSVLSRRRLPEDRYLEHIYSPNCELRKDTHWLDYVNLSISRINDWMFETSERWHQVDNIWWATLSFNPSILADPGVTFTTTNNIYPAARRGQGAPGLAALFEDVVLGRYSTSHTRSGHLDSWPTDRQAEVLYPGALPLLHRLQRIYVRTGDHVDAVEGMFAGLPAIPHIPVICTPEVFA